MKRLMRRSRVRATRRVGALFGALAVVLVALPIGSAAAAVQEAVGLSGTVLGFSGWYGSYTVAGVGTGFCLDFGKLAPDAAYAYRVAPTITGTTGAELAYVARTYGATRDAVTAAATKLVIHDLQGAVYPYGPLNVMTLQPSQVAGFNGEGGAIITKARAIMTDTIAHYLIGPYRLALSTPTSVTGTLLVPVSVTLLDGRGRPISGARVTLTGTNTTVRSITVTTDATGKAHTTFTATGHNVSVRITGSAVLPSPTPVVYAATAGNYRTRAQRIILAGTTPLTQTTVTTVRAVAPLPNTTVTITVNKTGDATAYAPVDGAQFELRADTPTGAKLAGPVTISNGHADFGPAITNNLADLWLVETTAPTGYALADPIAVPLSGTATVNVTDAAIRGAITLEKVDAQTRQPVAGAELRVRYDANDDGTYETDIGTFRTTTDPVQVADLLPGNYEVTEVAPPPGYELPANPVADVVLAAGGTLPVTFADNSLTTVRFVKHPVGAYNPNSYTLAGAVFVVTADPSQSTATEAGRCTTAADGTCALPDDSLVTGTRYCWTETVAPTGFAAAQGDCFTATGPSELTVVDVDEQGQYVTIEVIKQDASDPARVLAGARYELTQQGSTTTLATVTTGPDGTGVFPPMLPNVTYCVRELTAPAGYELDPTVHCTSTPVAAATTMQLTMTDHAIPKPTVTATPPVTHTPTKHTPPAKPVRPAAPAPPQLPHTGIPTVRIAQLGLATLLAGAGLALFGVPTRPRAAPWPTAHHD